MRWVIDENDVDGGSGEMCLRLMVDGRSIATVWSSGAWHTWDRDGVGGENSVEVDVVAEPCPRSRLSAPVLESIDRPNVIRAMREAQASAVAQGFHLGRTQKRKGGKR